MSLQEKLQDLNKELEQLKAELDYTNQRVNQITTEIVKKVGATEVLQELVTSEKPVPEVEK